MFHHKKGNSFKRTLFCTCRPEKKRNTMLYTGHHCEIHNPIINKYDKNYTYHLTSKPYAVYTLVNQEIVEQEDMLEVSSLKRTPMTGASIQPKQTKIKSKKPDDRNLTEMDAYGNPISTIYGGDDGLVYDARWYGVTPHVHQGVLVGSGML